MLLLNIRHAYHSSFSAPENGSSKSFQCSRHKLAPLKIIVPLTSLSLYIVTIELCFFSYFIFFMYRSNYVPHKMHTNVQIPHHQYQQHKTNISLNINTYNIILVKAPLFPQLEKLGRLTAAFDCVVRDLCAFICLY